MTPKNDEIVTSGTSPLPELNPLLNPTLNKNLGRWAEAYFTNPPEKRDQAVTNLLRELESETPTPDDASPSWRKKISPQIRVASPNGVICGDCGAENESPQRFCGECGAPLDVPRAATPTKADPVIAKADSTWPGERETDLPPAEAAEPAVPQFGSILHLTDPALGRITDASGHSAEPEFVIGDYTETTSGKRSYRLYIGTALALIVGVLCYVAWRGSQSTSEQRSLPPPSPTASEPTTSTAAGANSPLPAAGTSSPTASPAESSTTAESNKKSENAKPLPTLDSAANSNSAALSGNGSQELALAQGLLNAVGNRRDTATAAQWLWKAVQKNNTAATVLLAGLYLRGDGVQKNCDQGRILLDAAASDGSKDAANLLRNLQAFGCE